VHTSTRALAAVGVAVLLVLPTRLWAQRPNLTIAMSHHGNFTVGVNGVYTIVVSNSGGTAVNEAIEVDDDLAGLPFTFVSATGTNWSCALHHRPVPPVGDLITCGLISALAPGASPSEITLTVLPTVGGTWTNTVQVFSTETVFTDNTARDVTVVVAAVPTLPPWALIALTVCLALAGALAMRSRTT
jgi:hypothetical protein